MENSILDILQYHTSLNPRRLVSDPYKEKAALALPSRSKMTLVQILSQNTNSLFITFVMSKVESRT